MSGNRITIKGTSSGLTITLGVGEWAGLVAELERQLNEKAAFFKGGRVALRVGSRQLTRAELETVGETLSRHHMSLWAVAGDATDTQEAAAQLGLEVELSPSPPAPAAPPPPQEESLVTQLRRTLRSGQVLEHPGNLVLIGDVNPGAEIRAGGSVLVWGRLRGMVQAGLTLGDKAIVGALHLAPTQLRIGSLIARPPTDDATHQVVPELASVQEGQIVVEPFLK
jgi:septum site-determining protein MinC